ncbi:rod shape-determining protein RodA [Desulfosudis oleivorans]|uniref:Peptidoglycan glycosyltransferase RodA n=1 Tax=Desulfosudis oleivorans (strain DSM 6200 / JCM 39069 / Hxd3) TaxID=96561 RepID=A8ZU94_DESOH|nr:rod shape-determining protein RodA [Desulfosudis oleivorans]ABW66406.1 rod shape-determining protein RodA [Desulfosudis oleivorans Hxd3]
MRESWESRQFDWGLLLPVVALGMIGVIVLYSASASAPAHLQKMLCIKQAVWFVLGLVLAGGSLLFHYKRLDNWAIVIYIFSMALLVSVLLWGKAAGGSTRWLPMGPVAIQPSELAKIAMIIILARYYAKQATADGLGIKKLLVPILLVGIPFVLIGMQPDLGTAMLLALIATVVTLFIKVQKRTLYLMGGVMGVLLALGWFFLLKEYQKQRVLTFLNPDRDPLGAGYHIIQSKIAIGSGMVFGKGFMQGTQNALAFLPEQHTDFILSVMAEEWGLVGVSVALFLYLLIIIWGISIGYQCKDNFGIILAVGVTAMIFWHVVVNVGMVMGLLPVVGVPLPLISYGGSSVVTFMLGIGLLLNISMRRSGVE